MPIVVSSWLLRFEDILVYYYADPKVGCSRQHFRRRQGEENIGSRGSSPQSNRVRRHICPGPGFAFGCFRFRLRRS